MDCDGKTHHSKMLPTSWETGAFNTAWGPHFRSRRRETYFEGFLSVSNGQAVTSALKQFLQRSWFLLQRQRPWHRKTRWNGCTFMTFSKTNLHTSRPKTTKPLEGNLNKMIWWRFPTLFGQSPILRYACVFFVFVFFLFRCRDQVSSSGN